MNSSASSKRSLSSHRVAVTGVGMLTALGSGWQANARGFREGHIGLREITLFDSSAYGGRRAGEVALPEELPSHQLSPRQAARLDRASALLLHAASEATQQAQWSWEKGERLPVVLGTSAGSMAQGQAFFRQLQEPTPSPRGQFSRVILYQPQIQARTLLDALGIAGPYSIVSNACASGANAVGHGFSLIAEGRAQRVLCGGYDALCELVFAGFYSLQSLCSEVPKPFDRDRDGLALGEGVALLALEEWESARERGARILAEVSGYGAATDLHHLTQPHPEGCAAQRSMQIATESARLSAADVDYINAHGTGTPLNDSAEARAIAAWGRGSRPAVSSTKASIGHLLGAAGAVEAALCVMALREQWMPPMRTLENPDPACELNFVRAPAAARLRHVLTNSFGFGGANASVIFSHSEGGSP